MIRFAAFVVMVMACVNLTECHHGRATCFALNIGILICSLFGVLGAYRNDARLLGWFLMLIVFFIGFEVGFIIWSTHTHRHTRVHKGKGCCVSTRNE